MEYQGGVHYDDYGRQSGRRDRDRDESDHRRRDRDYHDQENGRSHGQSHRGQHRNDYSSSRDRDRDRHHSNGHSSYDRNGRSEGRHERSYGQGSSSGSRHRNGYEAREYDSAGRNRHDEERSSSSNGFGRGGRFSDRSRGDRNPRRPRSRSTEREQGSNGEPNRRRQRTGDDGQPLAFQEAPAQEPIAGPSNGSANGSGVGDRGGQDGSEIGHRGRRPRFVEDTRSIQERFDYVASRPMAADGTGKRGQLKSTDKKVLLEANYFKLNSLPAWKIYNYHVEFTRTERSGDLDWGNGDEEDCLTTNVKKDLLRPHSEKFGTYTFDGSTLFSSSLLEVPLELWSAMRIRGPPGSRLEEKIRLVVTHVADLQLGDPQCLQFYNLVIRSCLEHLRLELIGRNYYDPRQSRRVQGHGLELWPGYITSIRHHESSLMMNVEIVHRVLRQDTALNVIQCTRQQLQQSKDFQKPKLTKEEMKLQEEKIQEEIKRNLVGTVVMTTYNRKTYRITDVDFKNTPLSTFRIRRRGDANHVDISYVNYYAQLPQPVDIRNEDQPLHATRPKRKDFHRGKMRTVYLIPELCQLTGLNDEIRSNFHLMRDVSKACQQTPRGKMNTICEFMGRLQLEQRAREEFSKWNLNVETNPVKLEGRVLALEQIQMGDNKIINAEERNMEWTNPMRNCRMFQSKSLENNWVVVVPQDHVRNVDNLLRTMTRVGQGLGFRVKEPLYIDTIDGRRLDSYTTAVDNAVNRYGTNLQLVFFVLPYNTKPRNLEIWRAVKKTTFINYGISSQCFLGSNMAPNLSKGLMSIATKLVIQMNAKLGGIPWSITNSNGVPQHMMVIGYDVHHSGKGMKKESVGAMVATTNKDFTKYYSTTSPIYQQQISEQMRVDILKCLNNYKAVNDGVLPTRIIFYRDGVGEGQLNYVNNVELQAIKDGLLELYN